MAGSGSELYQDLGANPAGPDPDHNSSFDPRVLKNAKYNLVDPYFEGSLGSNLKNSSSVLKYLFISSLFKIARNLALS
jgi:hypothetical protein